MRQTGPRYRRRTERSSSELGNSSPIAIVLALNSQTRALAIWTGAVVALLGAIVTVVYFFQPWRTCPYDDAPSACAMLPADATVMTIAIWSAILGLAIFGFGVFMKRDETTR